VEFTGGSGPAALVGSEPTDAAARRGKKATPAQLEREPDRLGSHSCQACRAGPPMTGAFGTIVPLCRGPLRPPHRGPLVLRPQRSRAKTLVRTTVREREGVVPEARAREKVEAGMHEREERWMIRHACGPYRYKRDRIEVCPDGRTSSSCHYRKTNSDPPVPLFILDHFWDTGSSTIHKPHNLFIIYSESIQFVINLEEHMLKMRYLVVLAVGLDEKLAARQLTRLSSLVARFDLTCLYSF
jgi:hypothetical protein